MPVSRRGASGFTLAEMLVAVFLASILLAALVAFYASGIRHQSDAIYQNALQNEGLVALKTISQQLSQASFLAVPGGVGAVGSELRGGINVRPDNLAPLVPAVQLGLGAAVEPRRYFHFCLGAGVGCAVPCPGAGACPNTCLWFYEGPGLPPAPGTINCGVTGALPGGQRRVLARRLDMGVAPAPNIFSRPYNDVLRVDFTIRRPRDNQRQIPQVQVRVEQDIRVRLPLN